MPLKTDWGTAGAEVVGEEVDVVGLDEVGEVVTLGDVLGVGLVVFSEHPATATLRRMAVISRPRTRTVFPRSGAADGGRSP
jgi:hypothetical protein